MRFHLCCFSLIDSDFLFLIFCLKISHILAMCAKSLQCWNWMGRDIKVIKSVRIIHYIWCHWARLVWFVWFKAFSILGVCVTKPKTFIGGVHCDMIPHTHVGFLGSSVSLSGGDQVDGLPPAPSIRNIFSKINNRNEIYMS